MNLQDTILFIIKQHRCVSTAISWSMVWYILQWIIMIHLPHCTCIPIDVEGHYSVIAQHPYMLCDSSWFKYVSCVSCLESFLVIPVDFLFFFHVTFLVFFFWSFKFTYFLIIQQLGVGDAYSIQNDYQDKMAVLKVCHNLLYILHYCRDRFFNIETTKSLG